MCLMTFTALAFLFWEISHLGDSGTHLGYDTDVISAVKWGGGRGILLNPCPARSHHQLSGRDVAKAGAGGLPGLHS